MDKRFLDKVIDQIVRETIMDFEKGEIQFPFRLLPLRLSDILGYLSQYHLSLESFFTKHCRGVYGLNEQEIEYVWDEYKKIITDKLNNG